MLRVLCGEIELDEYGETIAQYDRVERLGVRFTPNGDGVLAEVEWAFDRYAQVTGHDAVTIAGEVIAVDAIYGLLAFDTALGGWAVAPDTVWLEPRYTTVGTRRPRPRLKPVTLERPAGGDRPAGCWGRPDRRAGDEHLEGWLITLDKERVTPIAAPA